MKKDKDKMILCACGCDELIPEFNEKGKKRQYVKGHRGRGKNYHERLKYRMIFCACGCGTLIPEFNEDSKKRQCVKGHQGRGENYHTIRNKIKKNNMIPCACGCGQLIPEFSFNKKRTYAPGHTNKGKVFSEESKKKMSEAQKGKKISEETRKKMGKARKGKKHSKEARAKISESNRKRKYSDETKQKISKAHKGKILSKETRKKMGKARKGKKHTEESKKKMSERQIGEKNHNYGKTASDETKQKMSISHKGQNMGEKNWNWQGGVSFEPYCPKFNEEFREKIREKFNRKCFLCGKDEKDNKGRKLSVHHISYDKMCECNGIICFYVPVCSSCHSKTNSNREIWQREIILKLRSSYNLIPLTRFFKDNSIKSCYDDDGIFKMVGMKKNYDF